MRSSLGVPLECALGQAGLASEVARYLFWSWPETRWNRLDAPGGFFAFFLGTPEERIIIFLNFILLAAQSKATFEPKA